MGIGSTEVVAVDVSVPLTGAGASEFVVVDVAPPSVGAKVTSVGHNGEFKTATGSAGSPGTPERSSGAFEVGAAKSGPEVKRPHPVVPSVKATAQIIRNRSILMIVTDDGLSRGSTAERHRVGWFPAR